jgi:hypothetical protein
MPVNSELIRYVELSNPQVVSGELLTPYHDPESSWVSSHQIVKAAGPEFVVVGQSLKRMMRAARAPRLEAFLKPESDTNTDSENPEQDDSQSQWSIFYTFYLDHPQMVTGFLGKHPTINLAEIYRPEYKVQNLYNANRSSAGLAMRYLGLEPVPLGSFYPYDSINIGSARYFVDRITTEPFSLYTDTKPKEWVAEDPHRVMVEVQLVDAEEKLGQDIQGLQNALTYKQDMLTLMQAKPKLF